MSIMKHLKHFASALSRGDFERSEQGIILAGAVRARGLYRVWIDGAFAGAHPNLVPTQGLNYFLSAGLANGTAQSTWYLALFQGAATPAANWTAANFDANADEITSETEGYSGTNRPQWVPGAAASGLIDNSASPASYSIVATTSITITGAGLISSQARGSGGASDVLASASRFDTSYTVNNGSTFQLTYEVELTDS